MSLMTIAILAGICPDLWRWRWKPPPRIPPNPIIPPDPIIPPNPITPPTPGDPWPIIGGIVGGVGGAIAWISLGAEFAQPGSLLAPVVLGVLGGAAALWLFDNAANLIARERAA
jgi:hypothetical protein